MKYLLLTLCFLAILPLQSQNWKMSDVPLVTTWAKDVNEKKPLNEYPRPTMVRTEWHNLNGIWQFQELEQGKLIPLSKNLTHSILVPFPWESALSGVRDQFNSRRARYKRTFTIPETWKDKSVLLNFGAVDFEASVYINGACVGSHKGGYDAFSFDITPFLTWKSEEIVVDVFDPGNDAGIATGKQANDKFSNPERYSYCPSSGIWQTVWLEPVSKTHISNLKLIPNIDTETLEVTTFASSADANTTVEASVLFNNKLIAKGTGEINIPFNIEISDPILWSTDNPALYDINIRLVKNDKTIDEVGSYVGMRKISIGLVNGVQKIFLNNKEIFQMGPLDQGYWPDGIYTAPTDEALRWDIVKTKEFGFNMIRKHIKIEPERWYYWCDKEGVLVWQDMPGTFKKRNDDEKAQFEWELTRMVQTHWNHPSIINWIVFNEHWGLYDVERLTKGVMALDPSRLVTGNSGIDAAKPNLDFEVGHIKDNHSYRPPSVTFVSNKRATVNGEYGAIGYLVDGHVWDTDGPWVHYNYENIDSATQEYERFIKLIQGFKKKGLCAAVYTQWTDVENEMNGIYTYDRKKIKLHKERVAKANKSTYE